MSVLKRKGKFFVCYAKLLRLGPQLHNIRSGDARLDRIHCNIQIIATTFIGIDLRLRRTTHCQGAIITSAIAIETMQDIVEGKVARPKEAVTEDKRMWIAALAGNRVDAFDMF